MKALQAWLGSLDADGLVLTLAIMLIVLGAMANAAGLGPLADAVTLGSCIAVLVGIVLLLLKTVWRGFLLRHHSLPGDSERSSEEEP